MIRIRVKKPRHPVSEGIWYPKARVLSEFFRTKGALDRMIEKFDYLSKIENKSIQVDESNSYSMLYGSRVIEICPYLRVKFTPDFTNAENVKHLEIPLVDIWHTNRLPTEEEIMDSMEKI